MTCAVTFIGGFEQLWLWAIVGTAGGLILFYRGFQVLQRKRLILNTPTSKIRSASLGLVEVNGLATGPYLIQGPITGKPCFYYRTIAWELHKSGKNDEWKKVADESQHVPFYLDDNTGLILVNPQEAEIDLHRDFHEEYSNSIFFGDEMPQNVRGFLARYGIGGEHKIRVEEYCIKPKNALFILGTLAENPGLEVGPTPIKSRSANLAAIHVRVGDESKIGVAIAATPGTFVPSVTVKTETEQEIINLSEQRRPLSAAEMTQQGKIAAALMKAGISNPAAWSAAGIEDAGAAVAMANGQTSVSTAQPGGAGASPARALDQFDLHPKAVLMKGENNPAFFISWRSQREIVSSLEWKSIAYIWGGPALTLVSVYLLFVHLGWL